MAWPSGAVDTTDTDSGTDIPASARADLLDVEQKLNQIIAHVSAYIQGLLDDADAAAARATLGLGALAVKSTIATADVDADAITYAKIQNVSATDKLLGRSTVGAGDVEEIACTAAGRALIDDADAAAQRVTLKVPTDQMGTGSGVATLVGVAHVNTTAVGNVGVGEDDLMTYSLPPDSLSASGKGIRVTAWGKTANNANSKACTLYFGTSFFGPPLTTSITGAWRFTLTVFRTGPSTQDIAFNLSEVVNNSALAAPKESQVANIASTETDTAAIVIRVTGNATANNDIVQEGMLVEFLN
jgi:hypothetical protein